MSRNYTAESTDPWDMLRKIRDGLLDRSDWTQLADSSLSSADKTAWATYRQQLRDLPENTVDPENPTFPEVPES